MDGIVVEWLVFALRWLHVVAAIAWIGASFYFIWLDQSLVEPGPEKAALGLRGELWAIHGGGIYEVGKYRLAPPRMPERLHWFKWEAYTTWLSGFALLLALYWLRADTYLMGPNTWISTSSAAIAASLLFLLAVLALYEGALRTALRQHPLAFAGLITLTVFGASSLAWQLFAPRAAALHLGAALATIMAANVFIGIIPAQKRLVAAIAAGADPDPAPAELAKLRSTHNNYFTLPVLICMLANHAPFLYGHPGAVLLLPALMLVVAVARHFFNLRNRGIVEPRWLVGAGLAFCFLVVIAVWPRGETSASADAPLEESDVAQLLEVHCAGCHAAAPSVAGYVTAPAGLVFERPEDLRSGANGMTSERLVIALETGYMPLANLTGMTVAERARLAAWIKQGP